MSQETNKQKSKPPLSSNTSKVLSSFVLSYLLKISMPLTFSLEASNIAGQADFIAKCLCMMEKSRWECAILV